MSEHEQKPEAPAEEESEEKRLEDLEPSEEDQQALRGGIIPPDT